MPQTSEMLRFINNTNGTQQVMCSDRVVTVEPRGFAPVDRKEVSNSEIDRCSRVFTIVSMKEEERQAENGDHPFVLADEDTPRENNIPDKRKRKRGGV